jgi:hypothetical protein
MEGPAISDLAGNVLSHWAMNGMLLKVLEELFNTHRELFPSSIPDKETRKQGEKESKCIALCEGLQIRMLWNKKWVSLTLM